MLCTLSVACLLFAPSRALLDFVPTTSDLITTEEVAEIFGVDRSTVTRWVNAGKLTPAIRRASFFLFEADAVRALVQDAS